MSNLFFSQNRRSAKKKIVNYCKTVYFGPSNFTFEDAPYNEGPSFNVQFTSALFGLEFDYNPTDLSDDAEAVINFYTGSYPTTVLAKTYTVEKRRWKRCLFADGVCFSITLDISDLQKNMNQIPFTYAVTSIIPNSDSNLTYSYDYGNARIDQSVNSDKNVLVAISQAIHKRMEQFFPAWLESGLLDNNGLSFPAWGIAKNDIGSQDNAVPRNYFLSTREVVSRKTVDGNGYLLATSFKVDDSFSPKIIQIRDVHRFYKLGLDATIQDIDVQRTTYHEEYSISSNYTLTNQSYNALVSIPSSNNARAWIAWSDTDVTI